MCKALGSLLTLQNEKKKSSPDDGRSYILGSKPRSFLGLDPTPSKREGNECSLTRIAAAGQTAVCSLALYNRPVITTYFFLCYCQNTTINLSHSLKAKHG